MRRVAGGLKGSAGSGKEATPEAPQTKASAGPRMQSAAAFYQLLGERRFGDTSKPLDANALATILGTQRFQEMTSRVRDEEVRGAVTNPSQSVTPERVYKAWTALLADDLKRQHNAPMDRDAAFNDALGMGQQVLEALREQRTFKFRNRATVAVDAIGKIGPYEPEILLARELAKRPELGGSDILARALDRCYVPDDVQRALAAQFASLAAVPNAIPPVPAAMQQVRLDDLGIIDALMLGDATYGKDVQAMRAQLQRPRSLLGLALNLRDQVASPLDLRESFARLASSLASADLGPEARELLLMLARLAASNEITSAVKKVAFLGIDSTLRRTAAATKGAKGQGAPQAHKSFAEALFAARAKLSSEIKSSTSPEQARLLCAAVDDLIADAFKQTRDVDFAAAAMAVSSDPGGIALRSVLDPSVRKDLIGAALLATTSPVKRGGVVAMITDKAERQAEIAKLVSANADYRPADESAALLLSWPSGVPRPPLSPEARKARADELASVGQSNLEALIDSGASEHEIFAELMKLGAKAEFSIGADELNIDETVNKIIRGQAAPQKTGWNPLARDTLTPLLQSTAIAALPAQMKHGASEADIKASLVRAIRTQNGQLITGDRGLRTLLLPPISLKLETVLDALSYVDPRPDPTLGERRSHSAVDPGANVTFAYRVLVECTIALNGKADAQLHVAARELLKRTGIVSLAPYAGMSAEDNLALLAQPPRDPNAPDDPQRTYGLRSDSPHFLSLLDTLTLPPTALASIASRPDLDAFPAETIFEIFARALDDKKVTTENIAALTVAATTRRAKPGDDISGTNVWATFNELATRNLDKKLGKLILDGMSGKEDIDVVYRAAATLASEGKLFDANQVAEAVLARDPAKNQALVNELGTEATSFFDALDVETRAKLLGRVLKNLADSTDASVLDIARPCFARLADLANAGHKPAADVAKSLESIVINAAARAARNPLEAAALGPIFADAKSSGVDLDKVVKTVLTDDKPKAFAGLSPGELAAMRFEVARLVPTCGDSDLKKAISSCKSDFGPYMAAFNLILERDLPADTAQQLSRAAIGWAAAERAFGRVVDMRKKLTDLGHHDRTAAFDAALTGAMQADPQTWSAVPEARSLAAITKLSELRHEIVELAAGGKDADGRARVLADRISAVGPYAPELVPQVLDALRRDVRALRPSLDDIHVTLDALANPSASANGPAQAAGNNLYGLPVPKFDGERGHALVPEAQQFVPTPTVMNNTKRFLEALDSGVVILLGDPGSAKSLTVRVIAHCMGAPLVEVDGGPERRVDEALGTYKTDKQGMPVYDRSKEIEVFTKGGFIVDNEFQTSLQRVLHYRAEQASRFNKTLTVRTDTTEHLKRHPSTKIVLIGNFLERDIPEELRRHARIVYFDSLPASDQAQIAQSKALGLPEEDLQKLSEMQTLIEALYNSGSLGTGMALSVRNLKRSSKRAEAFRSKPELAAAVAAREIYIDGVADPRAKAELTKVFVEIFEVTPEATMPKPGEIQITQGPRSVSIGEVVLDHGPNPPVDPAALQALGTNVPFIIGERERKTLQALAKAHKNCEGTLFYAESESGMMASIEAFADLSGHNLIVKDCNREVSTIEMFGQETTVTGPDGKPAHKFAGGFITEVAEKGGIVVLRNIHHLKDTTRIELHRMLEERQVPGPNGTWLDMHPDAQIILTTTPGEDVGQALQNRCTPIHLEAKTPAEVLERLVAMGEKLGVPEVITEQMVRFDGIWKKMINNVICQYVQRHNLPMPGMYQMIRWLESFAKVVNGKSNLPGSLDEQIHSVFVQGGLAHYGVPSSRQYDANRRALMTDNERVEAVLRAIADGNDAEVAKLAPNCE